jgi:hypothetical protein
MKGQELPFWKTEPCPPMCVVEHFSTDGDEDRLCESKFWTVTLTLEPARYVEQKRDAYGVPQHIEVAARHVYRERDPIVMVWHSDKEGRTTPLRLTMDEAETFANAVLDAVKAARS